MTTDASLAAEHRFQRLASLPLLPVGGYSGARRARPLQPVRDVLAQRQLLDLLIRRDLKARYKDSTLGFFWSLARPLLQLAIYFIVVGQFLQAARGIPDFAVYIFSGLAIMGLFSEIVVGATGSIVANSGLVKKVYVPREIFPLASAGSALFNFGIQLLVLFAATLLSGAFPFHAELAYALASILIVVVYGLAVGLLLGALNVYLRDMQYLAELGTMLLFWASPVVYSWQMVDSLISSEALVDVYTNNPLTLAVIGFQKAFWIAGADYPQPADLLFRMLIALLIGLVLVVVSHRVFLRLQGNFAQEL